MKNRENVRQNVAEQVTADGDALAKSLGEKNKQFVEKGADVYTTI